MPNNFELYIINTTFEQSDINKNILNKAFEGERVCNVESIPDIYIKFNGYIFENGNNTGVKLILDCGKEKYIQKDLKPKDIISFTHNGICVNDDGCAEDFTINYTIYIKEKDCSK